MEKRERPLDKGKGKGKGKAIDHGKSVRGSRPDFAANKRSWGPDPDALRQDVMQAMKEKKDNNVDRKDRIARQDKIYKECDKEYNLLITIIPSTIRQVYEDRYQEIQSNFSGNSDTGNWQTAIEYHGSFKSSRGRDQRDQAEIDIREGIRKFTELTGDMKELVKDNLIAKQREIDKLAEDNDEQREIIKTKRQQEIIQRRQGEIIRNKDREIEQRKGLNDAQSQIIKARDAEIQRRKIIQHEQRQTIKDRNEEIQQQEIIQRRKREIIADKDKKIKNLSKESLLSKKIGMLVKLVERLKTVEIKNSRG
jgi:isoleucyl-tRNA synthetase